jgi:hypothetical protein
MKGRGEGRRFQKGHAAVSNGRPVDDFFNDKARPYKLAWVLSLVAKGRSPDNAAKLVFWCEGADIAILTVLPEERHLLPPGKGFVYRRRLTPGVPSEFRTGARRILRQIRRYQQGDPKAAFWLQTMAEIFTLAFAARDSHDKAVIFQLAEKIGEIDFYTNRLAPRIDEMNMRLVRKAIAGI